MRRAILQSLWMPVRTMTKKNKIEWQNIRILPILHNRMEFALEVRRQFEEFKPDHVAVEYPATLGDLILKGITRLPLLSAVYYQETDGSLVYLLLEPTDGQVEALRLAVENHLETHFVDRDTEGYPVDRSPMPDSYAVRRIGHLLYCQAYLETTKEETIPPQDMLREKTMAYHLQKLGEAGGRILFVCGLYHLPGLLRMLERPQTEVIGRRHREGAGLAHLHEESSREVLEEMPFLIAGYERFRAEGGREDLDRMRIHNQLIEAARRSHWKNSKEELTHSQVKVLHKFARNYAFITGALVPNFYQLVVAGRGAADDNFCLRALG